MRRYSKPLLVLATVGASTLTGCNVLVDFLGLGRVESGASDLIAFQSEKEMVDYFKNQVIERNTNIFTFDRGAVDTLAPVEALPANGAAPSGSGDTATGSGGEAPPQPATDGSGGASFSQTTTQEEGVDESDVIKTDGTYVYMIDSTSDRGGVLRITRVFPADQMTVMSETPVEGFGRDVYLHNGKVVVLTSAGGFYATPVLFGGGLPAETPAEDVVTSESVLGQSVDGSGPTETNGSGEASSASPFAVGETGFVRPYTAVTIVDVSDPSSPKTLSTTRFEGNVSSSRMIDGVLHLVLSNFQSYYVDVLPAIETGVVASRDVAEVTAAQVVPDFQQEKQDEIVQGDLLTWETMFRPTDPDGFGVVTVVSLDVDNDASFSAVGVVAQPGLVYASTKAIYLTDTQWDFQGQTRTTTDIYKFAVENRGVTPVATGTVPGRILNQYSMGEYEGNLRVATTMDRQFTFNGQTIDSQNNVYVLAQEPSTDGLSIIGSIEGIAPGETIQSARFLGERGYLVTFLQMDPLFTLDLADPRNPQVVGKLKVPGFSTFLTPIDQDHVLAVGRYIPPPNQPGPWGVQLSIFDVSDFANPIQSAGAIIGRENGAESEALWNPKAFTYFPEGGMAALPIEMLGLFVAVGDSENSPSSGSGVGVDPTQDGGSEPTSDPLLPASTPPPSDTGDDVINVVDLISNGFRGVVVFDVSVENGLGERGRISTAFDDATFNYPSFTRGVFIDNRVYAVTDIGIRSAPIEDVSAADQSLTFDKPTGVGPFPTIEPASP